MRIGINCIELNSDYVGGVNTFALGLIGGFQKNKSNHTFQLYVSKQEYEKFKKFKTNRTEIIPINYSNFQKKIIWQAVKLNSKTLYKLFTSWAHRDFINKVKKNSDLLYTPTTTLNFFNRKIVQVVSMHDIQHTHFPDFFTKNDLIYRSISYPLSVEYASAIQASSNYIKDDLLSYFSKINNEKVQIINEGVDYNGLNMDVNVDVVAKYNLPLNYLFYPAQFWHHKNHLFLFKCLKEYNAQFNEKPTLVLTGGNYSSANNISTYLDTYNLTNQVRVLGKVPVEDLISLYKNATLVVSASLHESSSLPVLEAAALGTPLLVSNIPAHMEMGQFLQLNYFNPLNEISFTEALHTALKTPPLLQNQRKINKEQAKLYDWEFIANKYVTLFENTINHSKSGN